jgi:uncharacterized protein YkwD
LLRGRGGDEEARGRPSRRSALFIAGALLSAAVGVAAVDARAELPPLAWKESTQSPRPGRALEGRDAQLHAMCGARDAALDVVAGRNLSSLISGEGLLTADDLGFTLRAAGDPHVWARAWSVSGTALDDEDVGRRMKAWLGGWNALGERRCAIARGTRGDGATVVAAVAVDALADMGPLPTTARVGQWLTLEGTMLVPASAVRVVLLGPRGAPKTVLASLSGGRIRSTFSVDQAGGWLVQVLATVSTGPRPVLEAMVYAGSSPPSRFVAAAAPGEDAAKGALDDADAMLRMVNAARAAEGLPALVRDARLDALAQAHNEEMLKARMVGHDVGSGDLRARMNASGMRVKVAGENLASARSLEHSHRALWASPSHRDNMLYGDFRRMGVAVARARDETVWVTEVFVG